MRHTNVATLSESSAGPNCIFCNHGLSRIPLISRNPNVSMTMTAMATAVLIFLSIPLLSESYSLYVDGFQIHCTQTQFLAIGDMFNILKADVLVYLCKELAGSGIYSHDIG